MVSKNGAMAAPANGAMAAPAIFASPCNYELLEKSTFSYEKCTGNKQPKFNFSILSTLRSGLTMQKNDTIIFAIKGTSSTPSQLSETISLQVSNGENCVINQNRVTCTVIVPNMAIKGNITLTTQSCSQLTTAKFMNSNYNLTFYDYQCATKLGQPSF